MFFKSDRGVRCALKSSRSVFCDDVFFATIVFFATVLLFWLDKPPRSGKHEVFGVTVCFLRRCVFCDGVCFSDAVFVAHIWSCILQRVRVLLASVAGCFLRHCVCCAGQWVFFASIKSVSCTVKVCFLRRRGFFATESRVYSNIGLDSLHDCGG